MIEPYREDFNARFTPAKYAELLRSTANQTQTPIQFRISETPCFFTQELMAEMVRAGVELTTQLLSDAQYCEASRAALPPLYRVPNQDQHPHFMTVDFGLVRDASDELRPKLVEMQAFPSLFGYQPVLSQAYKEAFDLDPDLGYFLSGLDERSYWALLGEVIVGGHDPAHVVLAEVEPEQQKTRGDFRVYEQRLGIHTVDVAQLVKQGNRLFRRDESSGQLVRVERIYNRVIVDELLRKQITLPFDYRDELDVEWAGHPNWYFQISKFSIPHLNHATVPSAVFLDDWYAGRGRERLPENSERWVLKPLYSFAGKGVQLAPTEQDLAAIAPGDRHQYLLQERVSFVPVIRTPAGMTQAEIRILYVWPDGGPMTAVTNLVRMGRGLMMGVDHNRDGTWVGGSAGLLSPGKVTVL